MHDPLTFEACNIVSAIPQFAQNGGVICSKYRRKRTNTSRGAVELGCWTRLPRPAIYRAVMLFQEVIGLYLTILGRQAFWSRRDRRPSSSNLARALCLKVQPFLNPRALQSLFSLGLSVRNSGIF